MPSQARAPRSAKSLDLLNNEIVVWAASPSAEPGVSKWFQMSRSNTKRSIFADGKYAVPIELHRIAHRLRCSERMSHPKSSNLTASSNGNDAHSGHITILRTLA